MPKIRWKSWDVLEVQYYIEISSTDMNGYDDPYYFVLKCCIDLGMSALMSIMALIVTDRLSGLT